MVDFEAEININTGKGKTKSKDGNGGGRNAFAGGLIGSILGNLLSSVKALIDPINAIAGLLIGAIFPILKPFLILFIKVGILLFKFLNKMLGTDSPIAGLVGKTGEGDTVVGELGKKIALWGGIILGAIAAGALALFTGLPAALIGVIAIAVVVLSKALTEGFILLGAKIREFGVWLSAKFMEFVGWLGNVLSDFVISLSDTWNDFLKLLSNSWEVLKDFGQWVWDGLVGIFTTSFEALKGIGQWIWDKITGFFGFGGGDSSVNDAIITPNGDIIRTNPNDYLIATKTPESFGGGGNGGGKDINVNINGGLITEEVARDIGKIIMRELNFSGGF